MRTRPEIVVSCDREGCHADAVIQVPFHDRTEGSPCWYLTEGELEGELLAGKWVQRGDKWYCSEKCKGEGIVE